MNYKITATHIYDVDKLPNCSLILDAGCRDFNFSNQMADLGHKIIAFDIDKEVFNHKKHKNVTFINKAIVGPNYPKIMNAIIAGEGSRVVIDHELSTVETITMSEIVKIYGIFDLVKLDIEGSEYDVLLNWPGPISKQISVEFHEHTGQGICKYGKDIYDKIILHLDKWYYFVKNDNNEIDYFNSLWTIK